MNSRERFFNFIQGKPVDYRPWSAILSLYGAKLTNCPTKRYYNDADAYLLGQEAILETFDPDVILGSPFLFAGYGEAFGAELKYLDNYPPNVRRNPIYSAADIDKLNIPDVDNNPRIYHMRETLRRVSAAHRHDKVIVKTLLGPLDLPILIMGLDAWMITVLSDEEGVKRMLDITVPFFLKLCDAFLADGADALFMPMTFLTKDITTNHLARDFALPVLKEAFTKLKGPIILHHTGSSIFNFVDILDPLPNVLGFTMDENDDLIEARRRIRPESILFGGLDGPTLDSYSAEEVRSRTNAFMAKVRDDKKIVPFLVGTDTAINTPVENILAFRQSVREGE